jgi:hypothetical protein
MNLALSLLLPYFAQRDILKHREEHTCPLHIHLLSFCLCDMDAELDGWAADDLRQVIQDYVSFTT